MDKNHRTIKIVGERIYYTQTDFITFDQTNFPPDAFLFNSHHELFWEVELEQKSPESELIAWVVDYNSPNIEKFQAQKKKRDIDRLVFQNLILDTLETQMIFLDREKFLNNIIIDNSDIIQNWNQNEHQDSFGFQLPIYEEEVSFRIAFIEAKFDLGFVAFDRFIKAANQEVGFEIANEHILPEFDHIKSYFPKIFKRKTFEVAATIKIRGTKVVSAEAQSFEIESINEQIIDSVKQFRFRNITSIEEDKDLEKGLYSLEEMVKKAGKKDNGIKEYVKEEQDLIGLLIDQEGIRNKNQLEYLAGTKQNPKTKIRFTLKPDFGFLFLIEGIAYNHYCWELLDSHATYIWSLDRKEHISEQYKRVEKIINRVRESGRQSYKRGYKSISQEDNVTFNFIKHSTEGNGFTIWKHKLNEIVA